MKNPLGYMIIMFIIFASVAIFFKGDGPLSDSSKTLLTITSFVFGFYINSLITQARSRHSKVVESLREEGGYINAIYFILKSSFESEKVKKGSVAIDDYLVAGMDYRINDYAMSSPQFKKLYFCLMNLKPEGKQEDGGWNQITRIISEISKNRTKIETLVKERVSSFEWLTVISLLLLVLYFIFTQNIGSWTSILLSSCIATSLTMLITILYSLDSLRWKEDKWFWDPLEEMFISLDLIPYYPKMLVDKGRVKLNGKGSVRLAEYPNPYPDMRDKTITIKNK